MATGRSGCDQIQIQQQLERNGRFSRRNTRRPSLLQGILVCRECGYAYYRCSTRSKNGILREYYRCSGTDGHRRPEGRVCENRPVRLAEIDELVWSRVLGLLDDPTLIQAEIDRRLQTLRAAHPASARLSTSDEHLTIEQPQQIIRLVVREVLIGEDDVTIRHSIPVPTRDQPPSHPLRLGSREDPDPSARSHPADAADEARQGAADEPRLQAQRHHEPLRGA